MRKDQAYFAVERLTKVNYAQKNFESDRLVLSGRQAKGSLKIFCVAKASGEDQKPPSGE